jgi:hypothetical protein
VPAEGAAAVAAEGDPRAGELGVAAAEATAGAGGDAGLDVAAGAGVAAVPETETGAAGVAPGPVGLDGPDGVVDAPPAALAITVATMIDPLVTVGATVAAGAADTAGAASGACAGLPDEAISSMALASAARIMACT